MKRSWFAELRRRNVLRAGAFYIAAVWALAQGIAQLGPAVGLPDWTTRWFLVATAVGFPFWTAFAWFYEFTPDGLKRESEIDPSQSISAHTGKKLDRWIIGVLAIAVVLLLTNTFVWRKGAGLAANDDAAPIAEHSIAVLPFVNMSDDKGNEYFSDGISEELLNLLAKIPQLQVTARTSSFAFKGKEMLIPEIARTLHVANVLEGSVRKAGNSVRITAQLIKAGTGNHLWSRTYDRTLDDIFAVQDEIAADVVRQLEVTLLGAAPKTRTTDPAGYALYLQAIQLGRQHADEAYRQSDALLQKVLAIDARYAPAWIEQGLNAIYEAALGVLPIKEAYARAREAALRAIEIDPDFGPAHALLGQVAMYGDNDLAAAARHLTRALALDPADLETLLTSASLLQSLGRLDEALLLGEAIARRDPVNVVALFNLGKWQMRVSRYDQAIASFRTVLKLSPERGAAHYALGVAQLLKGDAQAALAEMQQEKSSWQRIGLPMALHALGRGNVADAAMDDLIRNEAADSAYNIAYVYAFRNDATRAFEWLDQAVAHADDSLAEIAVENLFDNIHSDARWLPLLRKLGKAPEQLATVDFKVTLPRAVSAAAGNPANP